MNSFTYMEDKNFSKGRKYIGASDMATLAKINPYKTPGQLWEEFTGRAPGFSGNSRTKWGHQQEPLILAEYVEMVTGSKEAKNDFLTSRIWEENQFMDFHSYTEAVVGDRKKAHADLLDLSGDIPVIVQAKNSGMYAANSRKRDPNKGYDSKDFSQDGIPLSVYFQEQWEMYMYGIEKSYVAVLVDGADWRLYGPIDYNQKDVEKLNALADRFLWHIDKDIRPEPMTWDDVIKMNPIFKPNTKTVVADQEEIDCRQMIDDHTKISLKIKELEKKKEDIVNALGLQIGGSNYLQTPKGDNLASVSEIPGRRTFSFSDLEKFPDLEKEIIAKGLINYSDEYRRLTIKGAPAGNINLWTMLTTEDGEKWKKSRKKYSKPEKEEAARIAKAMKIDIKWEKY